MLYKKNIEFLQTESVQFEHAFDPKQKNKNIKISIGCIFNWLCEICNLSRFMMHFAL
jgi:hypothetical protein